LNVEEQLRSILSRPIETPEDADRAREAADLLASCLRIEAQARRFLSVGQPGPTGSREESFSGLPLHEAARRVLEEAGVPLHARDLGARIKARGWHHPRSKVAKPHQIMHQLAARLPRFPEVFQRVAPQTFGLTSWHPDSFSAAS
jgi:hypothetical protein